MTVKKFQIAHIREQGQDMVIIPMAGSFRYKTNKERNKARNALQRCSTAAGLAGIVVLVWDAGGGRMAFLAPPQWRAFFSGLSLADVALMINKELMCG